MMSTKQIIACVCGVVFAFLIVAFVGSYLVVRNDGRRQELDLTNQYKQMMARYGQFRASAGDQLGIAREKRDALDKIFTDVIEKRSPQFVNKDGSVNTPAVVSAVREAYPDLSGLNIFDRLLVVIEAGRKRFAEDQAKLADQVRSFNDWRTTGSLFHPWFVSKVGFPSSVLEVRIGNDLLTGEPALNKMSEVIMTRDSQEIFDTGTDKPLSPLNP
jgi:hypothetical protein